jgi:peptide/nickel transport system permease protein
MLVTVQGSIRTRIARSWSLPTLVGVVVIVTYLLVALLAPWLAPFNESQIFDTPALPWGRPFLLGTDQLGRDILSRLIYGARNTIGIALAATCLSFVIGVTVGSILSLVGGWLDQVLSRFIDILMSIPSLIFSLVLLSMFGTGVTKLILLIAIVDAIYVIRISRAISSNIIAMEYVEVARLRGEGLLSIFFREILQNALPTLVVEAGLRFCFVFLTIASLSFLGVGVQPPTADWGSMVRENASLIGFADFDPWSALAALIPAFAIAILTIAVNIVVDGYVRHASDLNE